MKALRGCWKRDFTKTLTRSLSNTMLADHGCIEWLGSMNNKGYGVVGIRTKTHLVHRVVFFLHNSFLPEVVMHRCDNPACVNIKHLEGGTKKLNTEDMVNKGRAADGEMGSMSKLTSAQVEEARTRYSGGGETQREIAEHFGVHQTTIHYAVSGKTWKNLLNKEN